jgi:hypothetical protein
MGSKAMDGRARVRVRVGKAFGPTLGHRRLAPPLGRCLGVPWWRGKGTPSPLYKEGSRRRGMHNTIP